VAEVSIRGPLTSVTFVGYILSWKGDRRAPEERQGIRRADMAVELHIGTSPLTPDEIAGWEERVRQAGYELARSADVPSRVQEIARGVAQELRRLSRERIASVDPYLLLSLQDGAIQTLLSLDEGDPGEQRQGVRIGLERMRQALRDLADEAVVTDDRPIKEVVRWLVEVLDAPNAEVAHLLGTSPRTLQRWLSKDGRVQPHGEDAARVKFVARICNQLRHVLTGQGVIMWFESPHPELDERQPLTLLSDPEDARMLLRLAADTRVSGAT
jgi:putative toxin-antitoxin system antitoxin component (TIGR02293 family)